MLGDYIVETKKVLVVDDEEYIRDIVKIALSKADYIVHEAAGAEEALEILKQEQILVMFLDLGLDDMNGFELCEKIRKGNPDAIIYALTGHAGLFPPNEFKHSGFDEYFQKPFSPKDLIKIVNNSFEHIDRLAKRSQKKVIKHILIIDDDAKFRNMLRKMLEKEGYSISEACNGEEGILRFSEQHADLIIVDIDMPGKNGIETAVDIKEANPEAKFIVVSGLKWYGLEVEFDVARTLGAQVLEKPFERKAILEKIKHA